MVGREARRVNGPPFFERNSAADDHTAADKPGGRDDCFTRNVVGGPYVVVSAPSAPVVDTWWKVHRQHKYRLFAATSTRARAPIGRLRTRARQNARGVSYCETQPLQVPLWWDTRNRPRIPGGVDHDVAGVTDGHFTRIASQRHVDADSYDSGQGAGQPAIVRLR